MPATDIKVRIGATLTNLEKSLKKAERLMLRTSRKMERLGQSITNNITLPTLALGATTIKSLASVDKLRKGLEGMMGDTEKAAKEFNELRKLAKSPGLSLDAAVKGSIRLQAISFSAEKARKTLGILANAVALVGGSGAELDGVGLAISQIISKGKVQAEEINQIAERLPQVRKAMQDAFGTADTEVLQKMGIKAEDFVDGIVAELEKLPKAKASVADALQNLQDDFKLLAANIGAKLYPIFSKFMAIVMKMVNLFSALDQKTQSQIVNYLALAAALGPILLGMAKLIKLMSTLVGIKGIASLFNPWKLAIAGVAAAAVLVYKNWDKVKEIIVKVVNRFIDAYNESILLRGIVQAIVLFFKNLYAVGKAAVETIVNGFKSIGGAWNAIKNMDFKALLEVPKDFAEKQGDIVKDLGKSYAENFNNAIKNTLSRDKIEYINEGDIDALVNKATNKAKGLISKLKGLMDGGIGGGAAPSSDSESRQRVASTGLDHAKVNIKGDGWMSKVKEIEVDVIPVRKESFWEQFFNGYDEWADKVTTAFDKISNVANMVFSGMADTMNSYFDMKEGRIDEEYNKQVEMVNNTVLSEDEKNKRIEELEDRKAKKISEVRRKQAKMDKASSIFTATINTAEAITKALAVGGPAGIALAAVMGAMGAAQVAAIASKPIPALAEGGLVHGPTYALVGDNKNAKSDPEVISPLSKLKNMIGSTNVNLQGDFRLRGDDLLLAVSRAESNNNRVYGTAFT